MAENNRGDLTINITADVDEAVTGLKRLQRELRETTKAVRELEQAYKDVEKAVNSGVINVMDKDRGLLASIGREDIITNSDIIVEIDGKEVGKAVAPDLIDLSEVPTKELHEELAKREGVEEYIVRPHGSYVKLSIDNETHGFTETIEGPARIIVNKD